MLYVAMHKERPTNQAMQVCQYLWERAGIMTPTKFHKLAYYAQAWSLVNRKRPLFTDAIGAWPYGPVVRSLYSNRQGVVVTLPEEDRQVIRDTLSVYGSLTAANLTRLSHNEDPWINARRGLPKHARTSRIITPEAIQVYYSANGFATQR
jgi:uncharacterized phage-associated protein